jgi:hypothetical protein
MSFSSVAGHGMNIEELRANPRLTSNLIQDLNVDPLLPFEAETFDAILCTCSVQYLQRPEEVFAEVRGPPGQGWGGMGKAVECGWTTSGARWPSGRGFVVGTPYIALLPCLAMILLRGHEARQCGHTLSPGTDFSPVASCRQIGRVLKPGGQVIIAFSDRMYYSKAINGSVGVIHHHFFQPNTATAFIIIIITTIIITTNIAAVPRALDTPHPHPRLPLINPTGGSSGTGKSAWTWWSSTAARCQSSRGPWSRCEARRGRGAP